jgi:vanillate O-demethylase monooxygenase subunit
MTRYVRNVWYVAAWEDEIEGEALFKRTLLDRDWVIYRKQDGEGFVMLSDRCPHRFAPLSMGVRDGDAVVCPYHGLAFGETGACVRNPFSGQPPKNARVTSLPVVARHGLVWFWPGEASLADPDAIPDFSFLVGQDVLRRRSGFSGNYELLTDNLMDLSHVDFLHTKTLNSGGAHARGRHEVIEGEGGALWSNWAIPDAKKPPFVEGRVAADEVIEQTLDMRWHAPASMMLKIAWKPTGGTFEEAYAAMTNPHIITPETATSSHYFWTCAPEAEAFARAVFDDEDKPMIEAVQKAMAEEDFWELRPIILKAEIGRAHV